MVSAIHKGPIVEELKESYPPDLLDIAIGKEGSAGVVTKCWALMSQQLGHLELAYRRGIDRGKPEWIEITEESRPPHDTEVLLWSPPTEGQEKGEVEARKFSQGSRNELGISNYSQHAYATHWMPLPESPKTFAAR